MCGLGLGTQVGTQGVGLHLTYNFSRSFYLKLEGNYFDYSDDVDIDGVDYDGDLDFSNLGITANYLPFESSGFRVTLGAFFGQNKFSGTASGAGQNVDLNGTNYTLGANDSLRGSVEYDSINPYIGIGWDWAFGESQNIILGLDLGVSYLGDPNSSVTATGPFSTTPNFNTNLQAERQTFQNDIEDYKFYPVVKLSLTYRF